MVDPEAARVAGVDHEGQRGRPGRDRGGRPVRPCLPKAKRESLQQALPFEGESSSLVVDAFADGGGGSDQRNHPRTHGNAGGDQRPIIPAVFPNSVAAFSGHFNGQSVGTGEAAVAVVSTTSATPGTPAEGADQAHSTGAFESANLVPSRLQASLFFSVEDAARIHGFI